MVDPDGAALRYVRILRWRDRDLGERWSDAVRAAHLGDFADEGAP
jgi:hypothetical protein